MNLFTGLRNTILALFLLSPSLAWAFGGDGKTDIVWRNTATDQNVFWWMNEVHWFGPNPLAPLETRNLPPMGSTCGDAVCWKIVGSADFDRDGYTDLLWHDQVSGQNRIWFLQGSNKKSEANIESGDRRLSAVGTGDFNEDGYPDIVWRNDVGDQTVVWYMSGTNRLAVDVLVSPGPGGNWRAVAVGDFNNDGYPDLLWQNELERRLSIWYLHNKTQLATKTVTAGGSPFYPSEPGWSVAGTGSFNQTGNTDILWRRTDGQVALWLMRNEVFQRGISLSSLPYPAWQMGGTGGYITHENSLLSTHGRELAASISGANITLEWRLGDGQRPSIFRRVAGTTDWGQPQATNVLTSRWTDPQPASPGQHSEYRLTSQPAPDEVIVTAINGAPVQERGTVILVVEKSVSTALTDTVALLRTNLIGDGWKVRRVTPDVDRHDDANWAANKTKIMAVKNAITNLFYANPDTKAVILIGHVPIPHSGALNLNPDGHGARSLPADVYYGDMDGVWTDNTVDGACFLRCQPPPGDCSCGDCAGARHENHPSDGIWDQSNLPPNASGVAAIELAVGRIDFANMGKSLQPLFPGQNYEVAALRRYLNKDDRYRRKVVRLQDRVMVGTYLHIGDQWQQQLMSGLRIGSRLFGFDPDKIINGDGFYPENGCTWAVNAGFGMPYHMEGSNYIYHSTITPTPSDRTFLAPGTTPQTGFFTLFGSCFEDIAYPDNLLRAVLAAGTDYNLGSIWFGQSMPLHFESTALGDTVGSGFVQTINEIKTTYIAWMGDPTLRLQILAPATGVAANRKRDSIEVKWSGSPDPSLYYVYRSTHALDGPWTRLNSAPTLATAFTDPDAPPGAGVTFQYQVRGTALTKTASGSFYNLSQGAFSNSTR